MLTRFSTPINNHCGAILSMAPQLGTKPRHKKQINSIEGMKLAVLIPSLAVVFFLAEVLIGYQVSQGFNNLEIKLNPKTAIQSGVLASEAALLLNRFFQSKRK